MDQTPIEECAHCFGAKQLIDKHNNPIDCHVCKAGTLSQEELIKANIAYEESLKTIIEELPEEYDNNEY
jgi:arsenate reductase-like glutaredoxin family protein